jgi:hypothetical protein
VGLKPSFLTGGNGEGSKVIALTEHDQGAIPKVLDTKRLELEIHFGGHRYHEGFAKNRDGIKDGVATVYW